MSVVLIVGGALLGVVLGAALRFGFGSAIRWNVMLGIGAAAGVIGLFPALPGQVTKLPQLYCYVISVLTGYIAITMLDENPVEPPPAEPLVCEPAQTIEQANR